MSNDSLTKHVFSTILHTVFQYYEMSYGLNVEMHKQVSFKMFALNAQPQDTINNRPFTDCSGLQLHPTDHSVDTGF